ncbi:hypothetical protein LSAT2_018516 [Lamellibrachia satsuma]|nr:hypothetical protein LSAT2_018516 [Lamellibrachia satsuma]
MSAKSFTRKKTSRKGVMSGHSVLPIPQRWLGCPRKGQLIEKFLPFKTPLDSRYSSQIPDENIFDVDMFFLSLKSQRTERMETEKEEFRDALERMMGLVELEVMLCIAGDFNAHVGVVEPDEEESIGSPEAAAIEDCKAVAGEHVTQHKPVVFIVRMQKKKQTKPVGRMTIKWRRCKDDIAVEYKEQVTVKYEELSEEVGGLEEEWKKYKEAFVEEHRKMAECQGVVTKDGGQARLQRQYVKRRKPGKKLRRPRRGEINQMQG